jgi:4-hydroxy-3-methylbut-2-enyl diphosphate reductase IspH
MRPASVTLVPMSAFLRAAGYGAVANGHSGHEDVEATTGKTPDSAALSAARGPSTRTSAYAVGGGP